MDRVSAAEAGQTLAELAKKVADGGEGVVIEADGIEPVALVPLSELRHREGRSGTAELARRALEIGGLAYWIWDQRRDCYEICSEELARLFGYSLEGYLASHATYDAHLDHIHPDDRERYDQAQLDAERERRAYQIEFQERGADGGYRYYREFGYPMDATKDPPRNKRIELPGRTQG